MSSMIAKNLQRFKLVTFDVTDTLMKFSKPPAIQYIETAKKFGITTLERNKAEIAFKKNFKNLAKLYPNYGYNSEIDCHEWWRQLVVNVLNDASNIKLDQNVVDKVAVTLIKQYETAECWVKFDKADELIEAIRNEGICVGVISNFDIRLKQLLENMKFPSFDFILPSYQAGALKPEKVIFDKAINECKLNLRTEEALHIGNQRELDYKGAINAGWCSVLVNNCDIESTEFHHSYPTLEHFLINLETNKIKW